MEIGEVISAWTIRAALVCYTLVLAQSLGGEWISTANRRLVWTSGWLLYLAHAIAAFHYYHHWSHVAALHHTGERTRQIIGLDWGGGLYFNYAFGAVWAADVVWCWSWPKNYAGRAKRITLGLHTFMLLIAVNAVIVFESGPLRWAGIAAVAWLLVTWCRSR
ncbi:MAG: hypothetical protein VB876_04370 [Pirellulales bacterium]